MILRKVNSDDLNDFVEYNLSEEDLYHLLIFCESLIEAMKEYSESATSMYDTFFKVAEANGTFDDEIRLYKEILEDTGKIEHKGTWFKKRP